MQLWVINRLPLNLLIEIHLATFTISKQFGKFVSSISPKMSQGTQLLSCLASYTAVQTLSRAIFIANHIVCFAPFVDDHFHSNCNPVLHFPAFIIVEELPILSVLYCNFCDVFSLVDHIVYCFDDLIFSVMFTSAFPFRLYHNFCVMFAFHP